MARMTDEEADALDELVTKNPPKVSGAGKSGFFIKHKSNIVILDDVSATWLRVTSESTHKQPSELIGEIIWVTDTWHKRIAHCSFFIPPYLCRLKHTILANSTKAVIVKLSLIML